MQDEQIAQDRQFDFPYHHLAQFRAGLKTSYFTQYGLQYASSLRWIVDQIGPLEADNIIDINRGYGRLIWKLARDFPYKEVIGIDYSERTVCMTKRTHAEGDFRKDFLLVCDENDSEARHRLLEGK
ncbi:MAG: class I SAM-dependent methyltransferase [Bacteroidota bacterium]